MEITDALDLLKEKGYKYTGKREKMVRLFSEKRRYLSAKEVLLDMQEEYPNLSFDTIYRNLTLFEELGLLETTEFKGEKQYRFSCGSTHHHHHLICTKCRKTISFEMCPMNVIFGSPKDFMITGHKFEIYGYCSDCMEAGV
ncbi:Fur family transcriptional regulator [Aneurinibacillus sp. Ricciae_BoGa-3]|uniref:Fur family transcriptional regulator n=1 Tax=Aneurinibacillus sp. Ricciae_BoGa-3 TaxID=3022697 RepID=UPI0023416CA9|nr:Fur family transcriptional regulator [Aneurinibacillus sp. Ricciae_BoGa-3]WCK52774.1 Fur family transcriptional regulator [Aneurinibacillus sp. Ricciae_BoGa-3]